MTGTSLQFSTTSQKNHDLKTIGSYRVISSEIEQIQITMFVSLYFEVYYTSKKNFEEESNPITFTCKTHDLKTNRNILIFRIKSIYFQTSL